MTRERPAVRVASDISPGTPEEREPDMSRAASAVAALPRLRASGPVARAGRGVLSVASVGRAVRTSRSRGRAWWVCRCAPGRLVSPVPRAPGARVVGRPPGLRDGAPEHVPGPAVVPDERPVRRPGGPAPHAGREHLGLEEGREV